MGGVVAVRTTAERLSRTEDPARLAALRRSRLISDRAYAGLDRLTALATCIIGAPIALVTLIEADRQWFASMVGLPDPWAAQRQTPLSHSLCRHVVDTGESMVLPDAHADPALRGSPAVAELGIVSYVGHPLRAPAGDVLGALCVADHVPRAWTGDDVQLVADLAEIAADEISGYLAAATLDAERQEAAAARAFLEALLDSLDTPVAACDEHGRLVRFNRAMRQMLDADADPDLPPEAWSGRFQIMHPDGRPVAAIDFPLHRALAGEHVREMEELIIAADGRTLTLLTNAHAISGPDGKVLGAVAACHEASEERRAQRYSEAELGVNRILATAPDNATAGPAILEALAVTLNCVHAELWLDDDLAESILRPVTTWTHPEHTGTVPVPATIRCGSGLAGTTCSTGQPMWIPDIARDPWPLSPETAVAGSLGAALGVPIRSGEHVVGALTVFTAHARPRDEHCIALMARIAANVAEFLQRHRADNLAQQLANAKDEYIALVGHELRTPLTSIAAYTDLISDADDATPLADLRGLLEVVHRNSNQLRGIVDDLLDLAALDSGHAPLAVGAVNLASLVHHAVAAAAPAAEAQQVRLHVTAPEQLCLTGVEQRLRQLVDNLLSNAVKYSPDGGDVHVSLAAAATDAGAGAGVTLVVTDSGIGIPDDERANVFRRFYRSTRARDRGIPGTGLGLALCRVVADLHHGSIAINPTPDGGTTVEVRLSPMSTDTSGR